jgi:glycosyltransferase involved in cell wall biosynthesis
VKQLIVTSVPSFYKNSLFTNIVKYSDLKVFFSFDSKIARNDDFYRYGVEKNMLVKNEGIVKNIWNLYIISRGVDFITLGGWDDFYCWFLRLLVPKNKLRLIVESSIYELRDSEVRTLFKRFFIRGISECIVSGKPHSELVRHLGFLGRIKISYGVGVLDFSYKPIVKTNPIEILRFLYVGRISEDKGIDLLLSFFVRNKEYRLDIVGNVEDEKYSNIDRVSDNIFYHGYKKRDEMEGVFGKSDVLILCSKIEPWGLVVEEALYHGLPVIVSDKVGCNEDIVYKYNVGEVFHFGDLDDFSKKISKITCLNNYVNYSRNIASIKFNEITDQYIKCFL